MKQSLFPSHWRASFVSVIALFLLHLLIPCQSFAQDEVIESEITVPIHTRVSFSALVENKVIEWPVLSLENDFKIECSDPDFIRYGSTSRGKWFEIERHTGPFEPIVLTFTNIDKPELKFYLKVWAFENPANYVNNNLRTVYIGEPFTITIPEEGVLPLSDFTVEARGYKEDPDLHLDFSIEGNTITLNGLSEGISELNFSHKFGDMSVTVTVAKKPTLDDIIVSEDTVIMPLKAYLPLSAFISAKAVEGISGQDKDFIIESSRSDGVEIGFANSRVRGTLPVTTTLTFSNQDLPDITFSLIVKFMYSPSEYINENLGSLFVGQSKTLTLPEGFIPFDDFTITQYLTKKDSINQKPTDVFEYSVDGRNITITGNGMGYGSLHFSHISNCTTFFSEITVLPVPETSRIKTHPITIGSYEDVYLSTLIKEGAVEGLTEEDAANYTPSCEDSSVSCRDGSFRPSSPGVYTITYTHKEYADAVFNIEVNVRKSFMLNGLGRATLYAGQSKTFKIDDDCMPLSDYARFYLEPGEYVGIDPATQLKFEVDTIKNELTFTGLAEGVVHFYTASRYGCTYYRISILPTPSTENIQVNEKNILVPTNSWISLNTLIKNKIVEGVPQDGLGVNNGFICESSDTIIAKGDDEGYFIFFSPGTATITFSHPDFPEAKFDIEVTAKRSPISYIVDNTGAMKLNIGETKTVALPEDCLPFDYFNEIVKGNYRDMPDADFGFEIEDGKIVFTGISEGKAYLAFVSRLVYASAQIIISTREVAVETTEDGKNTAASQIGVPVTIDLPEEVKLEVGEGEKLLWKSDNDDVASIDPETGQIISKSLGVTTITVEKVADSQTQALSSRAGSEGETLVTIEFWVTELIVPEEINLKPGAIQQLKYSVDAGDFTYPYDIKPMWTSSDKDVVSVEPDGSITARNQGTAIITLTTTLGSKEITVKVTANSSFDINGDTEVNVSDVVSLVNLILNKTFDPVLHDLNNDKSVTVSDIVVLVNYILDGAGQKSLPSRSGALSEVPVWFDMNGGYTAMQTDVVVADGARIEDVAINPAIARSHTLAYNEIEPGRYRVIVYSPGNRVMNVEADEPLFTLAVTGNDSVETEATMFVEAEVIPTGIDSIADGADVESVTYFDLQGRRVSAESKGILIERTVYTDGTVKNRKIRK